jgi:hypothetical protein
MSRPPPSLLDTLHETAASIAHPAPGSALTAIIELTILVFGPWFLPQLYSLPTLVRLDTPAKQSYEMIELASSRRLREREAVACFVENCR